MLPPRTSALLGWGGLLLLLVFLLVAAATFDRAAWPGLVGDEATYIMAAQSLAFDGDYRYSKDDYDRFVATVGRTPDGLILQSSDGGSTMLFGKPLFYPISLAPFMRLDPVRGPGIANALLLAITALLGALGLRERFGAFAPLVMASLVFGTALFAHAFWAHSDLFLGCLVGIAYWLVFRDGDRREVSVAMSAALLATVVVSRPFYAPLALPVALAAVRYSRRSVALFVLFLAATFGLHLGTNQVLRGSLSSYSGERQGFYSYTGFPDVGDGVSWQRSVGERGSNSWTATPLPFGFEPVQTAWNSVYVLLGRHTGLIPYFFPLILLLWGVRGNERNVAILLGFAAVVGAFLLVRPYNYYGGGGALANRYLVPAIPALWFLRGSFVPWRLVVTTLGAALFMFPLWTAPRGYLLNPDRTYRYVSSAASVLPYETTQSHLKPSGREDFVHAGLWIKPLSRRLDVFPDGAANAEAIRVTPGDGAARALLGSRKPLVRLTLESSTGRKISVQPSRRAHHRMWWSDDSIYLYIVDLAEVTDSADEELLVRASVFRQE